MYTLYYAPAACSVGMHFLLEEMGVPYRAVRINIREGEQFSPEFVSKNPKSKVPVLEREDGMVITEFPAIAYWLAKAHPDKNLLPEDIEGQTRVLEIIDFAVSTIHMQGFSRIFRPAKFTAREEDHPLVQQTGREIVQKAFERISGTIGDGKFAYGDRLTIADAALFYVLFWACERVKLDVPQNCAAYFARLRARPAAEHILQVEGLA
jgi:glutathione S-transferase